MQQFRPAPVMRHTTSHEALPSLALLVGFAGGDRPELGMPFGGDRCERLPFVLLHAALACAPGVDCVVSPLFFETFDAMDMAHQLHLAGFRGRYVVVTPALPDPEIIRHEIAQLCPGITVELIPRARH